MRLDTENHRLAVVARQRGSKAGIGIAGKLGIFTDRAAGANCASSGTVRPSPAGYCSDAGTGTASSRAPSSSLTPLPVTSRLGHGRQQAILDIDHQD
jgi:hypothetical protein